MYKFVISFVSGLRLMVLIRHSFSSLTTASAFPDVPGMILEAPVMYGVVMCRYLSIPATVKAMRCGNTPITRPLTISPS